MAVTAPAPDPRLTQVDLVWIEARIEHWIRFGAIVADQVVDRCRRRVGFAPGAVFAFVRWSANDRGTVASRLDILQAVAPGEACSTVPGVTPGGRSLLRLAGWPKVRKALAAIDAIEALGVDPTAAAPDHWRHLHTRLAGRTPPRAYSPARHRAWRLRSALDT